VRDDGLGAIVSKSDKGGVAFGVGMHLATEKRELSAVAKGTSKTDCIACRLELFGVAPRGGALPRPGRR
jgi:hypothetical protein